MATILFAAAGAAIGGSIGGTFLGVSATVIGRAVGGQIGKMVDTALFAPTQSVEGPRLDGLDVQTSQEGAALPVVEGHGRIAGQIMWATRLEEVTETSEQGGKGGGGTDVTEYSYFANFAVALTDCSTGPLRDLGRVWADGKLLDMSEIAYRFYKGTDTQGVDPLMVAKDGSAPAYRGTSYVVFERLPLEMFARRIPNLAFEVWGPSGEMEDLIRGVDVIPAATEFGYMPTVVTKAKGPGSTGRENAVRYKNTTDWSESMDQLEATLPNCGTVALVVSWFGDDLRAGNCTIAPRVELKNKDTKPVWSVDGLNRATAQLVSYIDDKPIFGSTPDDASVVAAIQDLKARGFRVVLYPFIMMDILADNDLPDPDTGIAPQPPLPWRGRIRPAASESTASEVSAFLANYRPFILHLADLASQAGGVDAFLVGSEMVSMSMAKTSSDTFPFVDGLVTLAADVSAILPSAKISYAADWSEFHSYRVGSDVFFHLDPLWSSPNIDFVGIDNYLPLSDWRPGVTHLDYDADAGFTTPYSLEYLKGQIEGGEYWDYFYASTTARNSQTRSNISDLAPVFKVRTPATTISDGETNIATDVNGFVSRAASAAFSADVTFPSTPIDGGIFEQGGGGQGMWLGVSDGGTVFRLRAGDGAALPQNDAVSIDVPVASLPFDGGVHTVAWDVEMPACTIRLWVDGELMGEATAITSPGNWCGTGSGAYGTGTTTNIAGEPDSPWPAPCGDLSAFVGVHDWSAPTTPWIYRQKAIRDWWSNYHQDRPNGVSQFNPTAWVPESKPIWFTEFGCPAVNHGANQPNVFFDANSSEAALPYHSNGTRDDFMQRQYLRATLEWWRDNGGACLDIDNTLVWTWDARPWPEFPQMSGLWSDGPNWFRGHWLNGRAGSAPAAETLERRLVAHYGFAPGDFDLSECYGQVDGMVLGGPTSFREMLSAWELSLRLDASEFGGGFKIKSRAAAHQVAAFTLDDLVEDGDSDIYRITRSSLEETPRRAVVRYSDIDRDYQIGAARASIRQNPGEKESATELAIVSDLSRMTQTAETMLRAAADARESVGFTLPRSSTLEPGQVFTLEPRNGKPIRFIAQEVTRGETRKVKGALFSDAVFGPSTGPGRQAAAIITPASEVALAVLMDLPLLPGVTMDDHQGLVAFYAEPWAGGADLFRSTEQETGFSLNVRSGLAGTVGETTATLEPGVTTTWSGETLEVEIYGAGLVSRPDLDVLDGANALAVQHATGDWEILQFATAELIGTDTWRLSRLLRGQLGTEWTRDPAGLPTGARVVLINTAVLPVDMTPAALNREFWFRSVPTGRDQSEVDAVAHTFTGAARRPFAPVHFMVDHTTPSATVLTWIRRSRIEGDDWNDSGDIPLGEAFERYLVEVGPEGSPSISLEVDDATTATIDLSALSGSQEIRVSQVSETYGPGTPVRQVVDL